jgi:hypothetical protein
MKKNELDNPDEFMSLIDLFSRMIRNKCFDINFLEILAEENYKNIKSLLE